MKGIELPINILIIIAVAVIVLIAVIAMFYPAWSGGSGVMTSEGAKSAACQILAEGKKCAVATSTIGVVNFDANKNGVTGSTILDALAAAAGDNLAELCDHYYQVTVETRCKAMCGC